jgi:tetratricopeptide (TPR) repeat protein
MVALYLKNIALVRIPVERLQDSIQKTSPSITEGILRRLHSARQQLPFDETLLRVTALIMLMDDDKENAIAVGKHSTTLVNFLIFRGLNAQGATDSDLALQWFEWAAIIDVDNRDPFYYLALYYMEIGDAQQALAYLDKAVDGSYGTLSGKSDIYYQMGFVKQHNLVPKDTEGALHAYSNAIELDEYRFPWLEDITHIKKGNILLAQKHYEEAIADYSIALELNPSSIETLNSIANALEKIGELDQVEKLYLEAIRLKPENLELYLALGEVYMRISKESKAYEIYCKVLRLAPSDERVRLVTAGLVCEN